MSGALLSRFPTTAWCSSYPTLTGRPMLLSSPRMHMESNRVKAASRWELLLRSRSQAQARHRHPRRRHLPPHLLRAKFQQRCSCSYPMMTGRPTPLSSRRMNSNRPLKTADRWELQLHSRSQAPARHLRPCHHRRLPPPPLRAPPPRCHPAPAPQSLPSWQDEPPSGRRQQKQQRSREQLRP